MTASTTDASASGDGSSGADEPVADISGTHLLAVSASISPSTPFQFIATVAFDPTAGTMDMQLQPLSLDPGETTAPREFVGNIISALGIAVDPAGQFSVDLGQLSLPGEANPISGSDLSGTLAMQGAIQSTDLWCGTVTGMVEQPAAIDLSGSTFAAVRIQATDAPSLPSEIVSACP